MDWLGFKSGVHAIKRSGEGTEGLQEFVKIKMQDDCIHQLISRSLSLMPIHCNFFQKILRGHRV